MRKFGSETGRFYAQYLKKLKRCPPWRSSPWVARDPGKDHFFLSPGVSHSRNSDKLSWLLTREISEYRGTWGVRVSLDG